ncbi:tail fiber assembly protein [Lelliottia nimipressuralis]
MTFKMKNEDQTITVFNLSSATNEFIGAGDAYIPANTGLPAYCTDVEPPAVTDGNVAVFDAAKNKWSLIEDHRGITVYDTSTGGEIYINELGPLPAGATTVSPTGPYQKWNGTIWEDDQAAIEASYQLQIEQDRSALLAEANTVTADWRTELMLDVISDEDKASLTAWMAYTKELKAWDVSGVVDEKSHTELVWPEKP